MTTNRSQVGKAVSISALNKSYGPVTAVDSVDIDIAAGEFCTLLGPSGSGKTTLLKMIAGYESATSGSINIGGRNIADIPVARRNIGMVFQNYALFPHMTVAQNISFPLEMRKVAAEDCRRRADAVLDLIGLTGMAERLPKQLSGGQQQRVAVARALVFDPDILLMDEPLGALDKNLRKSMQSEIRALHDRIGVTIIYVTHDQEEAMNMSDRVVVMNRGKVDQVGSPSELYNRPATEFVARFLGDCNLLPGRVDEEGKVLRLDVAGGVAVPSRETPPSSSIRIGIRPERIRLKRTGDGTGRFAATVRDVSFFGPDYRVDLSAGGVEIMARCANTGRQPAAVDDTVEVDFDADDLFVLDVSQ